jgi:MFS family permease
MSDRSTTATRRQWGYVGGSALAMMVSSGPIVVYAFSTFLRPVSEAFGWGRDVISAAIALGALGSCALLPFFGGWVDRFGARRLTMALIGGFAASIAAFSMLPPSPVVLVLLYLAVAMTGVAQAPVTYCKMLSQRFDEHRGLALGLATAGVGLGTALMPMLSQSYIDALGWRNAYVALALTVLVIALPAAWYCLDDSHELRSSVVRGAERMALGLEAREAVRTWRYWQMGIAFLIGNAAVTGLLSHLVALLQDRGFPAGQATAVLSIAGVTLVAGRVIAGWALDRFQGPVVAALFLLLPAPGLLLIAFDHSLVAAVVAAALCGLGVGAEVDLAAFLLGRYFGLKAYGQLYGGQLALFTFGAGLGPLLMGVAFERFGSYVPMLGLGAALLFASACLLGRLGPYAFPLKGAASGGRPVAFLPTNSEKT